MKSYILLGLVLSLLTVAPSAFAQTVTLQNSGLACIALTGTLANGALDYAPTYDVTHLQTFLAGRGYLPITSIVGVYGPQTTAAVRAFQVAQGMPATGIVDATTMARINVLGCIPAAASPATDSRDLTLIGYDMPESLDKGELGAWVLQLPMSAQNSTFKFSAVWGDEGKNAPDEKDIDTKVRLTTSSQIVFTHTYEKAGHYRQTFNVKNGEGKKIRLLTNIDVK